MDNKIIIESLPSGASYWYDLYMQASIDKVAKTRMTIPDWITRGEVIKRKGNVTTVQFK